jgi:CspA family cold shock protein
MKGKIIRMFKEKQFGFISDGKRDYFFHGSELVGVKYEDLRTGQEVTFEYEDAEKGPRAYDISV